MTEPLGARVSAALDRAVHPAVARYTALLAERAGACAILFYGSNLRTGSLEGVLDFYVLLPGGVETGIWPRVSYHEWHDQGLDLRAKVASMTLATFASAAAGGTLDTTIWSRFVQPSALVWHASAADRERVTQAVQQAAITAAKLAVALGPPAAAEEVFWRTLFRATYRAELRIEPRGREDTILKAHAAHFDGLLPAALLAGGVAVTRNGDELRPLLAPAERSRIKRWWRGRRRLGKPLNIIRLVRAIGTFEGAARYAAWKVERHTGVAVEVTPWREKHPLLAAPGVLWRVWRKRRQR